jgi:hypothetical protein
VLELAPEEAEAVGEAVSTTVATTVAASVAASVGTAVMVFLIMKKGENGQQNASSDGQPKLESTLAAQKGQKLVI